MRLRGRDREAEKSTAGSEEKGGPLLRYVLAWCILLVIAVGNGALREFTFAQAMPELRAHQLSTLIGSGFIGLAVWLIIRAWPPASGRQAFLIGLFWLVLTVAFEFFLGLVLAHKPLSLVLQDYNLLAGRVWPFFLLWLLLAPWVFHRIRGAP
jgi:hypothetical protein